MGLPPGLQGGRGLRGNNGIFAPRDDAAKPPDPGFVKTYWPKALRWNGKGEARQGKARRGEAREGEGSDPFLEREMMQPRRA